MDLIQSKLAELLRRLRGARNPRMLRILTNFDLDSRLVLSVVIAAARPPAPSTAHAQA